MGKAQALKRYANSLHFREQAKVFNSPSTVDEIVVAEKMRWYPSTEENLGRH